MRYIHEYYHTYCNRITHVVQTWQTIAKLCKRNGGWRDCVSLNASVCLPARHQPMRWPCTRVWCEGANFPGLGGDCECWTWSCCCGNPGFHCWGRLLDRHSHLKKYFDVSKLSLRDLDFDLRKKRRRVTLWLHRSCRCTSCVVACFATFHDEKYKTNH